MKTGQDLLSIASEHIGEKYIFGSKVPYNNKNYTGPWGCAEFISWCVYQKTGLIIGVKENEAYTGYWAEDALSKCTEISIEEASVTPGAILLRIPTKSLIGHIVFSDGNNQTIEAMSTKNGVIRGSISGRIWHKALLIKGVDYAKNPNAVPQAYKEPSNNFYLQNPLMRAPLIHRAKQALLAAGIHPGEINDTYDQNMVVAVHNYQVSKGLIVDGMMGKETLESLKV